jgi:hypothetical protein
MACAPPVCAAQILAYFIATLANAFVGAIPTYLLEYRWLDLFNHLPYNHVNQILETN